MSIHKRNATRYYFRKGYARPCGRPRPVPALSTLEAASLVMGIIEARLDDGCPLDQINWPKYCRDSAVVQVVTQQLHQRHPELTEA